MLVRKQQPGGIMMMKRIHGKGIWESLLEKKMVVLMMLIREGWWWLWWLGWW